MPPPSAHGTSWDDRAPDGGWPGAGMPRAVRLWLPVIVSFLIQVPAVGILVWRSGGPHGQFFPVILALIGPLALITARRFPGPVVSVTAVAASALLVLRPDIGTPPVALVFAIILGIIRGERVWVYASVGTVWVATFAAASVFGVTLHPFRIAATTLGIAVAMAVGEAVRTRRERFREFRKAADARRLTVEQRERVRIARELHDVLAHSLSQINVQAGVGLHLIDSQPDKAAEALANIKSASKNALDEVRTVLGILRSDSGENSGGEGGADSADDPAAPLRPEPDLSSLPGLVESFRQQGLEVTLAVSVDEVPPPQAALQLALYRICQESLTNVLRHTNAHSASVFVGIENGAYLITVTDDGDALPPGRRIEPGGGLIGMRERAELLGGTFRTRQGENGGFQVEARIPVPQQSGAASEQEPEPR